MLVPPLDDGPALALLESLLGPERIAAERAAAEEIVGWCEGVPLALRILAARLTQRWDLRMTDLAERLRDDRRRLSEFRAGEEDLGGRIHASHAGLDPGGRLLFERMAELAASGTDVESLVRATAASPEEVQLSLDALVRAHLVRAVACGRDGTPVYRMPRMVRDAARALRPRGGVPEMAGPAYRFVGPAISGLDRQECAPGAPGGHCAPRAAAGRTPGRPGGAGTARSADREVSAAAVLGFGPDRGEDGLDGLSRQDDRRIHRDSGPPRRLGHPHGG